MAKQSKSSKKPDFTIVDNNDGTFNLINVPQGFLELIYGTISEESKRILMSRELLEDLKRVIRTERLKNLDGNSI